MNPVEHIITHAESLGPQRGYEYLLNQWNPVFDAACRIDGANPQNANTYSSQLVTATLKAGVTTKLQNILAPLAAFSREFSPDSFKPRSTIELKFASAATNSVGSATGKNLTNFEDGDSTVDAVSIAVDQYTRPFSVSNYDLQSGLRMDDLLEINTAKFADSVISVAMAPLTVGNIPATPLVSAAAGFDFSDLALLRGQLKKSRIKNLVLDGEYFSQLINQPSYLQTVATESGNGWKKYGWDGVFENTNWTGAGPNVVGVACHPQVLGVVAGLPVEAPVSDRSLERAVITVPGLDLTCVLYSWFALQSRTGWCSLDSMFGSSLMDGTAGILIKNG
jgi:hypothetical protein